MPQEIQGELFKPQTVKLIHKFKILKDLSAKELKTLLDKAKSDYQSKIVKLVQYEPNETVIQEGEFDSWIFWILKGQFAVIKDDVNITVFSNPGEVFGEMSALDVDMRSASVKSLDGGVCFSMDLSILDHVDNYSIRLKISNGIHHLQAKRLDLTTQKLAAEKRKIIEQQKEIATEKENLRKREIELQKREQALVKKEIKK